MFRTERKKKKKKERGKRARARVGGCWRKKIREGKNVSGMAYNGRIAREYNEILQCNSHKASETTKGQNGGEKRDKNACV